VSIDGSSDTTRPGDLFVDDTTTGDDCNDEPTDKDIKELTDEEEKYVARMEGSIQFFLDLLQVTGVDLSPKKCVWYLISNISLLPVHQSHRGIKMTSRFMGITLDNRSKAIDQGRRALGFYLTGNGTSSAHKKSMHDKGGAYTEAITNSTLQHGKRSIVYGRYYMPSLAYGTQYT
jgi:hypothetical protein